MKPWRTSEASGFGTVEVSGRSMEPTYHHGDWLVVRWFDKATALVIGKLYLIEREEQPGILYLKRLQKEHGGLAWFEGDAPDSHDSRAWGWIPRTSVRGRVLFRYRKNRAKTQGR